MMSARTAGRILAKTWSCGVWSWLHHPKTARQFWRRVARSILNEPGKSFEGLRLPSVELTDLLGQPDQIPVSLHNYCYQHGDMPLHEMVMLCRLIRVRQPRVIFEIGTFHGGTTLQMAANSAAQIYTLDLPPEAPKPVWDATLDVYPGRAGARFLDSPYAARITQLWGDSRTFDYRPYHGQCDVVFVDACHHYEFVKQDSANALRLVSPTGLVIWHDYAPEAPGVVQALEELASQIPLVHLADTCFVVFDRRGERPAT